MKCEGTEQDSICYSKKSDDVAQIFVNSLEETVKKIFGKEDKEIYEKSTHCYICEDELGDDKVRDHCHFTGRYIGAAHNKCNLKLKAPNFIPFVLHNLEGYDCHLFIKNLGVTEGNINCIPKNEEKYISFTKNIVVDTFMDNIG